MTERHDSVKQQLDRAERREAERVREKVAREVTPASQGPVGPHDVVGGPIPDPRTGGGHVDSDAAGLPGVPPERVRGGGKDG
jgi:hypothetical protein